MSHRLEDIVFFLFDNDFSYKYSCDFINFYMIFFSTLFWFKTNSNFRFNFNMGWRKNLALSSCFASLFCTVFSRNIASDTNFVKDEGLKTVSVDLLLFSFI